MAVSRAATPGEPEQGWKVHVSATILSAGETLLRIAPSLLERDVQFKAPASLEDIYRLNSGVPYGYSQIGKIITIYPRSSDEAVTLAHLLSEATSKLIAPAVPFEERFGLTGCLYYRYGSFRSLELENPDGSRGPAIRTPDGQLITDDRNAARLCAALDQQSFFKSCAVQYTDFRLRSACFEVSCISRTYSTRKRWCLPGDGRWRQADATVPSQEGRAAGEMSWDGRDGAWRVMNEQLVIESLRSNGVNAPKVYDSFRDENNSYLVLEFIEGRTLHQSLIKRQRRLSVAQCLNLGVKVSELLASIHEAGWVWRDCKTSNIMITNNGSLRPIDFEGACRFHCPDNQPWGTPGFTPPWRPALESRVHEDLYALGAVLYFLFTGRLQLGQSVSPVHTLRSNVPQEACRIVEQLLTADTNRQPAASDVAKRLTACHSQQAP